MTEKLPFYRNVIPLKLQFFAEQGEGSENPSQEPQPGDNGQPKPDDGEPKPKHDDNQPEKKYSDDDVDEIIKQKLAKWKKQQQEQLDENKKYEEMTKAEKAEYNRKKADEKAEQAEKALNTYRLRDSVRQTANENGLTLTNSDLDHLVTGDAETTNKNVDWFIKTRERLSKSIKEELYKGNPPKFGTQHAPKGSLGEELAKRNANAKKNPYFN